MEHRNDVAESHDCFHVCLRFQSRLFRSLYERCHFGSLLFHVHMACLGSLCSAISQINDLSPFQIASIDSFAVERLAQYVPLFLEEAGEAEGIGMVYSTFSEAVKSLVSPTDRISSLPIPWYN
jgi:hypothetical protein